MVCAHSHRYERLAQYPKRNFGSYMGLGYFNGGDLPMPTDVNSHRFCAECIDLAIVSIDFPIPPMKCNNRADQTSDRVS